MSDDIESLIARSSELSKKADSYSGSPEESKSSGMFAGMGAMGSGMMTPGFLAAPQKTEPAPEPVPEIDDEPAFDDFSKEIREKQKKASDIAARYEKPPVHGAEKTDFPIIDAAKNWALESIEKGAEAISFGSDKPTPDALTSQLHQLSPSNVTPEIKTEAAAVMDPVQLKQWPAWFPKTKEQHRAEFEHRHAETSMADKAKEAWNVGVGIGKGLLEVGTRFGAGIAKAPVAVLSGPTDLTDRQQWAGWGKNLLAPAVSVVESAESVAQTVSNALQNGLSAIDWVEEQTGAISRDEAFDRYYRRKRADEYYAGWKATDPNVFTRVIMEDPKTRELVENMAYSLTSIWSPSVDDRLQRYNGDRDAAMREKQLDDLRDSQQLISNFRQEASQMVPESDIVEALSWTRFGMNPFDIYGRAGAAAGRGISKGLKAAKTAGKTAEQIAAMEAEAAAKAFEAELKAAEAAKTPGWVEGLAGKVADKVEPAAAWVSARYSDLPESVQQGLAKMGSGMVGTPLTKTAAILANAGVAAPRIAQAALAGRRLAAGGVEGGFEAGAKAATEAAAKTGLSPKAQQWLANKSIPAAKTLDWMAQNSMEMARGSVHGATLAAAVGVLENKDIEEIADMMGEGIFLHVGGEVMGNMAGVSHARYINNLKRQRASAAKWFNELDPQTQKHVKDLGDWDSYLESLKGLRDVAVTKYNALAAEAENATRSEEAPGKVQKAQDAANDALIEANIRSTQVANAERANSDTQKMYRDNLNIGMADVMTALNGSSKAGRNVEMRFTTTDELAREVLANNRDKGLTDLELIELFNFVKGASGELAFIAENGGKHTLTSGKVVDLYTPYKDRININMDAIKQRMFSGESALNAFGHEAGHAFWNIKEFREGIADTYKELFGNQKFDERGNLIGGDPGLFSVQDLLNKFKDYYARGYDTGLDPSQLASMTPEQQKAEAVKRLAQKIGLWDPVMQELDPNKTAAYMRHEMMAELIQGGAQGGIKLGANPKPWLAPLVDWATVKQKNTKTGKKVRSAFGLTQTAPWDSALTGTRFSSEQVEATRNALQAVSELNGDINAAEIIPHAPITETQLRSNEAVANQFGEAFFAHEKVATVLDKDGNVIESRVVTDPNAMEGTFEHGVTETGDPELRQTAGYGPIPAETYTMPVPEGGRITITSRIKRDASGSLSALTPDQVKALSRERANIIRKAILDAPDREYPGRMDVVSADGLSLGGRLSPKQIEAIKGLPETIIPFGLKRRILEFNDLLVRDNGDAMIGLYGQAMDRQGRYKSFAPKIVDFVPLGMRLSKDGNILFNMFSKTGMREKLRRWQRDTPELLSLWNGDGEAFMGDVRKVLENWKPREGAPAGLPGETGLDADPNMAISKKNRVNDFLNIFRKTEPESLMANPARTTMRRPARRLTKAEKLDEESSDPNTLIRSYRVDRFHDLEKSSDAPFRVNYGKALYNLMPAKSEADQRAELPAVFEPSILKGLRSINAYYMGAGAPAARLPLDTAETFVARFKPRQNEEDAMVSHGFYSKAGAVLLDKMPNRASAAQLKGILDPQKGSGVKPEELKWSGINQFIDATQAEKGFITKDDIRKWLQEDYAAQFETKVMRPSRSMSEDFEFYSDNEEWGSVSAKFKTIEEAVNAAQEMFGMTRREAEVFVWDTNEAHSAYTPNETEYSSYTLPGGENYKEIVLKVPGIGFRSTHFSDVPDYVAHLRTAEHGTGLLIEEAQSDLHQKAREKGYKEPVPVEELLPKMESDLADLIKERERLLEQYKQAGKELRSMPGVASELTEAQNERIAKLREFQNNFEETIYETNAAIDGVKEDIEAHKSGKRVTYRGSVPDAPFRKDWPLQLFKYALKDAVATGKEWIGWTGGEKQAERYDLSEQVDSVNYDPFNERLIAVKNEQRVFDESNIPKEKLANYIGKEAANKLLQPDTLNGAGNHVLSGNDLKVGGEGMKGFYDVMLPKEIGKYVKQWGAKVEPGSVEGKKEYIIQGNPNISPTMTFTNRSHAVVALNNRGRGEGGEVVEIGENPKIWKIAITPEMRESVAGGQTRFMPSVAVVPERFTGTGEEEQRRGRYVEPPKAFRRFDISQYEPGGKFFDAETGEDLTNKSYETASIAVVNGKPTLVANNEAESTGTGPLFRANLFKQKAGWKWVSEGSPDTSTIVSVQGQGKHLYALQADFQNGVKMARYEDKASEPRLRPTGRGELTIGEQIGTIDIRGREHPVYDRVTIGAEPESTTRFSPAKLDSEYTAAFEAKDEEKARVLVDEAAKQAGYNINPLYHGTATMWDSPKVPIFLSDEATANAYATDRAFGVGPDNDNSGIVRKLYTKFKKTASEDDVKNIAREMGISVENDQAFSVLDPNIAGEEKAKRVLDALKKQGYDSAKLDDFSPANFDVVTSFVAFDQSQLKSADPFTYDNTGRLIPLSERFDTRSGDIRFSPSRLDAEYVAAQEAKDEKKARRLVDEAAMAAGFSTERFYHGTPTGGFNEFDPALKGTMGGHARGGFSFTTDRNAAEAYSQGFSDNDVALTKAVSLVNKAFRKLDSNPEALRIIGEHTYRDSEIDTAPEYGAEFFDESPRQIRDWLLGEAEFYKDKLPELSRAHIEAAKALKSESASPEVKSVYLRLPEGTEEIDSSRETLAQDVWGLDVRTKPNKAFIVNLDNGDRIAYVANPEFIKSADTFTYDNTGRLIPLSERFNVGTGDIRFMPNRIDSTQSAEDKKLQQIRINEPGRTTEDIGVRPDEARNRGGQRTARGYSPLPGAPNVFGRSGPIERISDIADQYAESRGLAVRKQAAYVGADIERGRRIAEEYAKMPHDPQNPRVQEAYADLIRQSNDQYNALVENGFKAWFIDPANDPYEGKPWRAMRDLRENESMGVFPTESGFGSGDTELNVADNPLLGDSGLKWPYGSPDGPLKRVLWNDVFRYIHDAFGHGIEGAGFRADGEENAWQAHVRLFYGPAVGAMTSETRGQNSWLNFGPHAEKNKNASVEETVFADQKTGLMPEWTWKEGVAEDEPILDRNALSEIRFMPAKEGALEGIKLEPKDEKQRAKKNTSLRVKMTREALTDAALSQESWKNWYSEHQETLDDFFGKHAGLFQNILAITSQAASVKANVGLALKAFGQLMRGEDFDGYLPAVAGNLAKLRDETGPGGQKIQAYKAANEGDTSAVVVDRHIARMLFGVDTPSAKQFAKAAKVLTEIADKIGWTPAQVQAALWAHSIVQSGKQPQSYGSYLKQLESEPLTKKERAAGLEGNQLTKRIGGFGEGSAGVDATGRTRGRYSPNDETGFGRVTAPKLTEDGNVIVESNNDGNPKPFNLTPDVITRFMPAQGVNIEDYSDRTVICLPADRMGVGKVFVGPTGKKKELSIEAQGGRGFMNIFKGGGWAFSEKGAASSLLKRLEKVSGDNDSAIVAVTAMSPINHLKNQSGQLGYVEALRAAIESKTINKKQANAHIKSISDSIIKSTAASIKDTTRDKFKNIRSLDDLEIAVKQKSLNFGDAEPLLQQLQRKTHPISFLEASAIGISPQDVAKDLADPDLFDVPFGSVVALLEIPWKQQPEKTDFHYSYPWTVEGKAIGYLNAFPMIGDLTSDPRVRNSAGVISAQPLQTVLPILDKIK